MAGAKVESSAQLFVATQSWTLPAYDRYEAEVGPEHVADVVVAPAPSNRR
jgi:hypothetical protein